MSLPDLCIAPCEAGDLAPDEPLCAPAEYRVRVWRNWRFHTYLVRRVKTVWVEMYDRKFFAAQNVRPNSPTLFIELPVPENPAHSFQIGLGKRFYDWRWKRLLFFDDESRLTISRTNWKFRLEFSGRWHKLWGKNGAEETARFELERPFGRRYYWHSAPNHELAQLIIRQLANPNSDCAFVLRCLQMTKQQRTEFFFPVLRGTREECDSLLRLILQTESLPRTPHIWSLAVPLATKDHANEWNPGDAYLAFYRYGGISFPGRTLTPRQRRLLELVVHHFGLHWNNLHEKYSAQRFDWGGLLICAAPFLTTQHERLEAHLQLRNWLSDKVAPEEIPFLLGEQR